MKGFYEDYGEFICLILIVLPVVIYFFNVAKSASMM